MDFYSPRPCSAAGNSADIMSLVESCVLEVNDASVNWCELLFFPVLPAVRGSESV